jgi:hypothetical protein
MIITVSQYLPNETVIDMFSTLRRGGFNDNMIFLRGEGKKAIETKLEWVQTTLKDKFVFDEKIKLNWKFNGVNHIAETYPKDDEILTEGSGGDYLSNEIFYRVAKLRKENKSNLPTGHLHVEKLQEVGEDINKEKTKKLINLVIEAINNASKKI